MSCIGETRFTNSIAHFTNSSIGRHYPHVNEAGTNRRRRSSGIPPFVGTETLKSFFLIRDAEAAQKQALKIAKSATIDAIQVLGGAGYLQDHPETFL